MTTKFKIIGGVVVARHTAKSCVVCSKTELLDDLYRYHDSGKIWFCSNECRKTHKNLLKYYLSNTFGPYLADLMLDKREYNHFEKFYRRWMKLEDSKNKHDGDYQKFIGFIRKSRGYCPSPNCNGLSLHCDCRKFYQFNVEFYTRV